MNTFEAAVGRPDGLPPGLRVWHPPTDQVPSYTQLFREGWEIPKVMGAVSERVGEGRELMIVSAGCSVGAEADSFLAYHNVVNNGGRVALRGFDTNPHAVLAAGTARHLWRQVTSDPEIYQEYVQTLSRFGFRVDDGGHSLYEGGMFESSNKLVDSSQVRARHDVRFALHDLAEPLPVERPADLILANNILHHLTPEKATAVIRNLASCLANRGVLSIGHSDIYWDVPMREMESDRHEPLRFGRWLKQARRLLSKEFDLKDIASTPNGYPMMFARS